MQAKRKWVLLVTVYLGLIIASVNAQSCSSCGEGIQDNSIAGNGQAGDALGVLQVKKASVHLSRELGETLTNYGNVRIHEESNSNDSLASDPIEVNLPGRWINASRLSNTDAYHVSQNFTYDPPSGTVTKVYFEVTSASNVTYYYEYDTGGPWPEQHEALTAIKGKNIPLTYTKYNGTKQLEYVYDVNGNVITQHSKASDGIANEASIVYAYDASNNLTSLWAGLDPLVPANGRTVNLAYDENNMLTSVSHGCGSCGIGARTFTYHQWNANPYQLLSHQEFLPKQTKDASGAALFTYEYDNKRRKTTSWLGASGSGIKISEASYTDDDKNKKYGLVHRQYVYSAGGVDYYRAKEYIETELSYATTDVERHYHDLQSGDTLKGAYSKYENGYALANGTLWYVSKRYPNDFGVINYYDPSIGQVTKVSEGKFGSITGYVNLYTYSDFSGYTGLAQAIDRKGGTTDYDYTSEGLLTKMYGVNPNVILQDDIKGGPHDPGRLTTEYHYDADKKMTKHIQRKSGNVILVQKDYSYDGYGNLISETVDSGGVNAITSYEYNEYNEQTLATDPEGNKSGSFYSDSGVLTKSVQYASYPTTTAISEIQYEYDNNGWLTKKRVAQDPNSFSVGSPASWIDEVSQYDNYGRKTAVIADSGGKNLTTSYEYNYQSEITKVTNPDGRYQKTVRDGRGLVSLEINGYGSAETTTQYHYDFNGNLTRKIDPEGVTEVYQYDLSNQLTRTRKGK